MKKIAHYMCPECHNIEEASCTACECGHVFESKDLLTGDGLFQYRSMCALRHLIAWIYAAGLFWIILFLLYHFIFSEIASGPWEMVLLFLMAIAGVLIVAGGISLLVYYIRRRKQKKSEEKA